MSTSTESIHIRIHYMDGSSSTHVVDGYPWQYRGFLCFEEAGTGEVSYLPQGTVRRWTAPAAD